MNLGSILPFRGSIFFLGRPIYITVFSGVKSLSFLVSLSSGVRPYILAISTYFGLLDLACSSSKLS